MVCCQGDVDGGLGRWCVSGRVACVNAYSVAWVRDSSGKDARGGVA